MEPRPELPDDLPPTLVVGASGFLGRRFLRAYRRLRKETPGTSHRDPGLLHLDLEAPQLARLDPRRLDCSWALLLAGCTAISECEERPEATGRINVAGTLRVAEQLLASGMSVVFFSSDYVFSGDDGPYADDAPPAPRTEYGRQKAQVERRLLELDAGRILVARLAKVYGLERGDGTLFDEMASALAAGRRIRAAPDQVFCPTHVDDVIEVVARLQSSPVRGVVNVCAPYPSSRYDLARELARQMDVDPDSVEAIPLADLGLPGDRPRDTRMVCGRLSAALPHSFLHPRVAIGRVARSHRCGAG